MSDVQTNLVGRTVRLVKSGQTGTIVVVFADDCNDIRYVVTTTEGDDRGIIKTYCNGDFVLMSSPYA